MRTQRILITVALVIAVALGYVWLRGSAAPAAVQPVVSDHVVSGNTVPGDKLDHPAANVRTPASDLEAASAVQEPGAKEGSAPPLAKGQLVKATFASGCFWCTESDFDKVAGVVSTTSGYTGGHLPNPTYQQVSSGGTGHAESVELLFDPSVVSYQQLLDHYWHNVDPFNSRGQFCDFGEQYRPVIFVHGPAQRAAAEASEAAMEKRFGRPIVVAIEDAGVFYPAEDYHQDFHTKNSIRYQYYRWGCGRDARLAEIWGKPSTE